MSQPSTETNPYDEVPYPSQPLPQTHPDRMAAIATLFGMQPTRVDRCRVLELGCAAGGNLIPMADRHPDSAFVGIDYSHVQIAAGLRNVAAAGLKNIELRQMDIRDLGDQFEPFDYMIGHGLFSWVSPQLQEKILEICASRLSPQGIAYLSYNIYPGWHMRGTIRELLCRCVPSGSPEKRVAHGRKVVELLLSTVASQSSPYSQLLKAEIDFVKDQPTEYLFHEYYEVENWPVYFHEFVRRAAAHGLQYLGEAATATMFVSNFGPIIEQQVMRLSNDDVSAEQHLDVLRNRTFRQTLLCHQGINLSRRLTPDRLQRLRIAGRLEPQNASPDLKTSSVEKFAGASGLTVSSPDPTVKAALLYLGRTWPQSVSIDELVSAAASLLGSAGNPREISPAEREGLGHNLVQCMASGLIDVSSAPDSFTTSVSRHPTASRLARIQARSSRIVTNRRHESATLDEASQNILRYLDGEHDHEALLQELVNAVDRGNVSILFGGIPATRGAAMSDALDGILQQCLAQLAAGALLVA